MIWSRRKLIRESCFEAGGGISRSFRILLHGSPNPCYDSFRGELRPAMEGIGTMENQSAWNEFATGRIYDSPQVIRWRVLDDGRIEFRDDSRHMGGIIPAPLFGAKDSYVLRAYDSGNYV